MYTRVRSCVPGHNSARNFAALLTRGELPRWKRGSPLSLCENLPAFVRRRKFWERNFRFRSCLWEIFTKLGTIVSRVEAERIVGNRWRSFQISIWTRILLEFCEREWVEVDSREAKLLELSSRAFWMFPLIGGGIGLARGRSIKCRILCQRGRGRCNVFNVRRSSTIPPCLPW